MRLRARFGVFLCLSAGLGLEKGFAYRLSWVVRAGSPVAGRGVAL